MRLNVLKIEGEMMTNQTTPAVLWQCKCEVWLDHGIERNTHNHLSVNTSYFLEKEYYDLGLRYDMTLSSICTLKGDYGDRKDQW